MNRLYIIIVSCVLASMSVGCTSNSERVVEEAIMTRTSIRQYKETPVESEKIEKMLRAAMAAPTACNKQPWAFVVVDDKSMKDSIASKFSPMKPIGRASVAIVVCGDMDKALPDEARDYWIEDTSAATENLLLSAHAQGLGAVWCGIYPTQDKVAYMKSLLSLPSNIVPLGIIAIGYPAENPEPKDKWNPEIVKYNGWETPMSELK